ncbi:MAG: hypothetical protein K6B41_01765 [Butyrivibrio sp.]|nr:hypothetical protein [Butyrivibrio sp.]
MDKMYYKIVFFFKPNDRKLSKEKQRLIFDKADQAAKHLISESNEQKNNTIYNIQAAH